MLDKIKRIFYRPEFFAAQQFTTGQALKFYSLTIFVFVVVMVVIMLPGVGRVLSSMQSGEWQNQKQIIENMYPKDLVLTVDHGTVSTNVDGPVVIAMPKEWQQEKEKCGKGGCEDNVPTNLLVIDTENQIDQKDFAAKDTAVIIGAHEFGVHDSGKGETRIFDLRETNMEEKVVVNEGEFQGFVDHAFGFLKGAVVVLMLLVPVLMYAGLWIGYLIYTLFGALAVWVATSIRGYKLSYGRAYLSALYLLPASFLLYPIMSITDKHVPFAFTIVLFLMALVNFKKQDALVVATPTEIQEVPKDTKIEVFDKERK
jgi:hypothetical protein